MGKIGLAWVGWLRWAKEEIGVTISDGGRGKRNVPCIRGGECGGRDGEGEGHAGGTGADIWIGREERSFVESRSLYA